MARRVLPDPRLPRSPRVRDRWARMRPPVQMRHAWPIPDHLDPWEAQELMEAAVSRWRDHLAERHGQGEVRLWLDDHPTRTLTAEYHPDRNNRRNHHG